MVSYILKKLFGTKNGRVLKGIAPLVARINELEPAMQKRSDEDLRALTGEYRRRLGRGETLDSLLPEAFATCREAGKRVLNMRHFDVQLVGGTILHRGVISEMKTGEGKTLVATLPAYLNALEGKGVHVVTVNDYLARRDAEWMGRIYKSLGLTVGVVVHGLTNAERQAAYRSDIAYGMNSELGFDYLRDNMKLSIEDYVQRDLHYAIVDEVDSILVDEARTPLIISGPAEESADLYTQVNGIIPGLRKDIDFTVDEKAHSVMMTDSGVDRVEQRLKLDNLYDAENIAWLHHVNQALRAHTLYKRDVNYLIEEGKVVIVDEFTGRKMPGRRWSDGLHQAIEAKEGVEIQEENQTLATISYQNFFRLYKKLCGMTGTADTEAEEFSKIYKLDVNVIPTNRTNVRKDADDVVYKNEKGKFRALVNDIEQCHQKGQPVLVGTVSVEKSEVVASMLRKKEIPHSVLNAKQHEREALIVAQAGRKGSVTISTNMAGRGTDILLGGNPEMLARAEVDPENAAKIGHEIVEELQPQYQAAFARWKDDCEGQKKEIIESGGLQILGTERHESRRVDNQLRGRAGRQGDPGGSRFYLSLEDDLMRIFGAERITGLMERLGMEEDVPIEHPWINKSIESAQKRVEGHNFDIRKNLLEYDDVMNQQRKSIYALRRQVLEGRYARELSPEEKKAGKKPVTADASGKHTQEALTKSARPQLAKMADALSHTQGAQTADGTAAPMLEIPLNVEMFRSSIYRQFGTYPDVTGMLDDRTATLDRLSTEIASSMLQQRERLLDLAEDVLQQFLDEVCPRGAHAEAWNMSALVAGVKERFGFEMSASKLFAERDSLAEYLWGELEKIVEARESEFGLPLLIYLSRSFFLEEIDARWIEHLRAMEALREGIGLRGYGQKDPKQEYKKEGFVIFQGMLVAIQKNVCEKLFHVQVKREGEEPEVPEQRKKNARRMVESGGGEAQDAAADDTAQPQRREGPKVGRNDPCPCGSGKKYKKCHGVSAG